MDSSSEHGKLLEEVVCVEIAADSDCQDSVLLFQV
jgi:hypothetical protein